MTNINEEGKQVKENEEFENAYKEYKKKVKAFSGGLVKTNRLEFIKMYSFYATVTEPTIMKFWNAYLGKEL